MRVDVADGKYTYIFEDGHAYALRYGEPWDRDVTGDKFIYCLASEVESLRQQLGAFQHNREEAFRRHEETRQQLASRDAEVAKLLLLIEQRQAELASVMRANSNKFDTIMRLNKQLAECEKQVKLLRDAILKRMASENRWPDYIQEALAATEPKP